MADRTISVVVERLQERFSRTPGYRPGNNGSTPLAGGERFTNLADGKFQIGDGVTPQSELPVYPLVPGVDDVLGLREVVDGKAPIGAPFVGSIRPQKGLYAYNDTVPPNDSFALQSVYTVNYGPATATGLAQTYISFATNNGFDCGYQLAADFRGTHDTNTQSKLGHFLQVGSPQTQTNNVGAAVAEWNLTNRGADTGYQQSISSPETYGGTVPYQQVGGLNFVPEANYPLTPGAGTNVTYGYMVSRSSNTASRLRDENNALDYPRTYTGYGSDRDSLVPASRGVGGEGGRFFSAWGGVTAVRAPSAVGQAWGFWVHGIDLSRATFASNDPIRVKAGQEVVWETGTGTKIAGLSVTVGGALTLTNAAGVTSNVVGGAWTTYVPTYTIPAGAAGGSGVTITHNSAAYEIAGKSLRVRVRFTISWTGSAPSYLTVSLPPGVTLKDGSAGVFGNFSSGGGGFASGINGNSVNVGGGGVFGGSGSIMILSLTAEIA